MKEVALFQEKIALLSREALRPRINVRITIECLDYQIYEHGKAKRTTERSKTRTAIKYQVDEM